jgi:hypothetical protein
LEHDVLQKPASTFQIHALSKIWLRCLLRRSQLKNLVRRDGARLRIGHDVGECKETGRTNARARRTAEHNKQTTAAVRFIPRPH